MIKCVTPLLLLFSLGFCDVYAQSYRKDSLQFKIYTTASFKDSNLKSIKLKKVFCDYCSNAQITALGQLGLRMSNKLVKQPENRIANGQKQLAIYLRVAKKKFANLKRYDTIN